MKVDCIFVGKAFVRSELVGVELIKNWSHHREAYME